MNEQELLEYNNRRAKWQREFYAKKMVRNRCSRLMIVVINVHLDVFFLTSKPRHQNKRENLKINERRKINVGEKDWYVSEI